MDASFIDDAVRKDRAIRRFGLVCDCAVPITWYQIPGSEWTDEQRQTRIDEATSWYRKYCIELDFQDFALDPAADAELIEDRDEAVQRYRQIVATIPRAVAVPESDLDAVQTQVLKIDQVIRRKVGGGRLVVLFLDEWYVLTGETAEETHWRQFRVSATDGARLLVGLDRYDRGSTNIPTHELTHLLRKPGGPNNTRRCVRRFIQRHQATPAQGRTWADHYAGANQARAMSRPPGRQAFQPFNQNANAVLSVTEYLLIQGAGHVACDRGCDDAKRVRRRSAGARQVKQRSKPTSRATVRAKKNKARRRSRAATKRRPK